MIGPVWKSYLSWNFFQASINIKESVASTSVEFLSLKMRKLASFLICVAFGEFKRISLGRWFSFLWFYTKFVQCESLTETSIVNNRTITAGERAEEFEDHRRKQLNEICHNVTDEQFEKFKEAENAFNIRFFTKYDHLTYSTDFRNAHITKNYTALVNK